MTRTMYDSTTAADIPLDAPMVAGYVDLWSAGDWDRFPASTPRVRIARNAGEDGDVLDVESGDATPDDAPPWVQRQRARGATPCVYMSGSVWETCRDAFRAAGVPEPLWWVAGYAEPNDPSIPPPAIAHQYASPAYGSGGHWDLSSVVDYWPGVDPTPSTNPHHRGAQSMDTFTDRNGNTEIWWLDAGGALRHRYWDNGWKDEAHSVGHQPSGAVRCFAQAGAPNVSAENTDGTLTQLYYNGAEWVPVE